MASSSSLSLPSPQLSLPCNWIHDVFPNFHGADVRIGLLSHILKEFRNKGINTFIDNEIRRGEFIGPVLKRAIRGSKIGIVLLSKNYACSSWCLDELVEIMKCRDMGQTVMTIFYDVDPTDVKKQTGYFGEVFTKTCEGKTEKTETWRKALEGVATIAGYHLKNWDNEAAMIEEIAAKISKMLNRLTPSCDFERFIGMGAHIEKMKLLLCMDLDEVRMIGIWGPPGIGKSTLARVLFNQYFTNTFQLSAIMVNIKGNYPRPCLDEGSAQLQLQSQMLSQMLNHKDMVIGHLGVAKERLKDKKVLLVLDDVDRLAQLDALAKETRWFGPGSRIIITTQDLKVLHAHGTNHIYKVDFPSDDEALQMFCTYAFNQKYPKDGFRKLSWEVTHLAGKLPLGLKIMGSYFRGMSKQEWKKALPSLRTSLHGDIESVLKFSYDSLYDDDKYIFLHIACFFFGERTSYAEDCLVKRFPCVSQRLDVLAEKSLICIEYGEIEMHGLLLQLGREIVRKQSPEDPGQRQFLVDSGEIFEILADNGGGSEKVIGIDFYCDGSELNISERAFEKMSNLQFLKLFGCVQYVHLPSGLCYLSPKLRVLDWDFFPLTCFPSNVNLVCLVELKIMYSKLTKLWKGIKPLPNLKRMFLSYSKDLKELPDLSTAINLQQLDLVNCSSLVELPAFIENLQKLRRLNMRGCSKLEVLPVNVNLQSLYELDLSDCSLLKRFPEISTNIWELRLNRTAIEEVPSSMQSWSGLYLLDMSHCENLKKFLYTPSLDSINEREIRLEGCTELVSFGESPERKDWSLGDQGPIKLNLSNCFKLNKNARDLIIQKFEKTVLVGGEIPTYFTHQANGGSLTVTLDESSFPLSLKFKVCFLLVNKNDIEDSDKELDDVEARDADRIYGRVKNAETVAFNCVISGEQYGQGFGVFSPLRTHLYIFAFKADVTSNELSIKFGIRSENWTIKECGLVHNVYTKKTRPDSGNCEAEEDENEGDNEDEDEENESDSEDEEYHYAKKRKYR